MADKAKKITELPALTDPSGEDLLVIVDNPNGSSNATKKVTLTTLFSNTSANVSIRKFTPANSSIVVKGGTIFFDDNFLYVATSNNIIKRISFSSF
ncbi:hypothetical protein EBU91_05115 [bacterium]|nr:hypothetical protein [bacterium]